MIRNWNGYKELEIFDRFNIDYNLPKHQGSTAYNGSTGTSIVISGSVNGTSLTNNITDSIMGQPVVMFNDPVSGNFVTSDSGDTELRKKSFNFRNIVNSLQKKYKNRKNKQISVIDFFKGIETNMDKLQNLEDLAKYYENAVVKAKKFGQTALAEKIVGMIDVVKSEANLCDEFKYVTEKQVIDLYEKTDKAKNLKLS